jgi:hypothetical protein
MIETSGQVEAAAAEVRGATRPPNTRPYQRWTAVWFLASPGHSWSRVGRAQLDLGIAAGSRRAGSKKGAVDVAGGPRSSMSQGDERTWDSSQADRPDHSDGIRIHRIG